jgi:subtilisin family serine protease
LNKIQAPAAWSTTTGSSSIIVAIIDTGIDPSHPDLASKLVAGWNTYDNSSNWGDYYGHGTKVAGTVAAVSNNGVGVASVCWNCLIMPVRAAANDGNATFSSLAAGLTWAADHGARVAEHQLHCHHQRDRDIRRPILPEPRRGGVLLRRELQHL